MKINNNDDKICSELSLRPYDELLDDNFALNKKNADLLVELERCKQQVIYLSQQIVNELDHEKEILRRYEALSNGYSQLENKYGNIIKSPFIKIIYMSWDVYNKIKYNKRPSFLFK